MKLRKENIINVECKTQHLIEVMSYPSDSTVQKSNKDESKAHVTSHSHTKRQHKQFKDHNFFSSFQAFSLSFKNQHPISGGSHFYVFFSIFQLQQNNLLITFTINNSLIHQFGVFVIFQKKLSYSYHYKL